MIYKNSIAIIRTKKGNAIGCYSIFTGKYCKLQPHKFDYSGYKCDEFEILETVGGKIVVNTIKKTEISGIEIKNQLVFSNVESIKMLTEHEI